jgi:hypothetical protein
MRFTHLSHLAGRLFLDQGFGMVLIFVEDEFLQALDTQAMQITIAPR